MNINIITCPPKKTKIIDVIVISKSLFNSLYPSRRKFECQIWIQNSSSLSHTIEYKLPIKESETIDKVVN